MKKNLLVFVSCSSFFLSSCIKDLDKSPIVGNTSDKVYSSIEGYKQVLAKIYSGFALTGIQRGDQSDILGVDVGFSDYLRQYWSLQELSTDEAVLGWNDIGLTDLHYMNWTSDNNFLKIAYSRIYLQVAYCNEFLNQSALAQLNQKGFSEAQKTIINGYRNEVRFLRALSYWHGLDLFGSIPFITEQQGVGNYFPPQASKKELYDFVVKELQEIENTLPAPKQNQYGRADKAAAWALLTHIFINAEVYTGTDANTECVTYCNKIIAANTYALDPVYENVFKADNDKSPEIIFPIVFDAVNTQGFGGMVFLVHAQVGGTMKPVDFGIKSGWAGMRTTKQFFNQFKTPDDKRKLIHTDGQSININDITAFTDGYAIKKFSNKYSTGYSSVNTTGVDMGGGSVGVDTDFPMFRLADIYLLYAEAVLRGGQGGTMTLALEYFNKINKRASPTWVDVTSFSLDDILAERARELFWEAHRRTDLRRFKKLTTGDYVWAWKGKVAAGTAVDDKYNWYPIPSSDIAANPNLKQTNY